MTLTVKKITSASTTCGRTTPSPNLELAAGHKKSAREPAPTQCSPREQSNSSAQMNSLPPWRAQVQPHHGTWNSSQERDGKSSKSRARLTPTATRIPTSAKPAPTYTGLPPTTETPLPMDLPVTTGTHRSAQVPHSEPRTTTTRKLDGPHTNSSSALRRVEQPHSQLP